MQGVCERTLPAVPPLRNFCPQNYEPNYAYPLIIWLHEAGHCERDIVDVLPKISMRNYIGLSLRGTAPAPALPSGKGVPGLFLVALRAQADFVSGRATRQRPPTGKDFHIHTERVFLAGAGEGASLAWELFLAHPNGSRAWPSSAGTSPGDGVPSGITESLRQAHGLCRRLT